MKNKRVALLDEQRHRIGQGLALRSLGPHRTLTLRVHSRHARNAPPDSRLRLR